MSEFQMEGEREEERNPKQSWDERLEGKQVSVLLVD